MSVFRVLFSDFLSFAKFFQFVCTFLCAMIHLKICFENICSVYVCEEKENLGFREFSFKICKVFQGYAKLTNDSVTFLFQTFNAVWNM